MSPPPQKKISKLKMKLILIKFIPSLVFTPMQPKINHSSVFVTAYLTDLLSPEYKTDPYYLLTNKVITSGKRTSIGWSG